MEQSVPHRVTCAYLAYSWVLSFLYLDASCFQGVVGARQANIADLWKPLRAPIDAHDDLLNYTFGAKEFGAPWGDAAATNDNVGISFGIFRARGQSLDQLVRTHFDPWNATRSHPSFRLDSGIKETLANAAKGANIKAIAFFVHGFLDNGKGWPRIDGNVTFGSWPAIAAASFSILAPQEYLAVAVDWESGASGLSHYPRAMSTTRVVALYLRHLFSAAKDVFGSMVRTWCVGHSLGAHACGLSGKYSARDSNAQWDVISGLDPAGPSITLLRSVGTSWVDPAFQNARLSPNDARYTEVLYTDWGGLGIHTVLAACLDKQHWYTSWRFSNCSKTPIRLGHLEAFVNPHNYTAAGAIYPSWLPDQAFQQPGCDRLHLFCSHHYSKSLLLFGLSRGLRDGAFTLDSTCGRLQMEQDPLNICPRGHTATPVQILRGPEAKYDLTDAAYSFNGLLAPRLEDLEKRYPDSVKLAASLSFSKTYGREDAIVI